MYAVALAPNYTQHALFKDGPDAPKNTVAAKSLVHTVAAKNNARAFFARFCLEYSVLESGIHAKINIWPWSTAEVAYFEYNTCWE